MGWYVTRNGEAQHVAFWRGPRAPIYHPAKITAGCNYGLTFEGVFPADLFEPTIAADTCRPFVKLWASESLINDSAVRDACLVSAGNRLADLLEACCELKKMPVATKVLIHDALGQWEKATGTKAK